MNTKGNIDIMDLVFVVGFIAISSIMLCVFFDIGTNTHSSTDASSKLRFLLLLFCICILCGAGYYTHHLQKHNESIKEQKPEGRQEKNDMVKYDVLVFLSVSISIIIFFIVLKPLQALIVSMLILFLCGAMIMLGEGLIRRNFWKR